MTYAVVIVIPDCNFLYLLTVLLYVCFEQKLDLVVLQRIFIIIISCI